MHAGEADELLVVADDGGAAGLLLKVKLHHGGASERRVVRHVDLDFDRVTSAASSVTLSARTDEGWTTGRSGAKTHAETLTAETRGAELVMFEYDRPYPNLQHNQHHFNKAPGIQATPQSGPPSGPEEGRRRLVLV